MHCFLYHFICARNIQSETQPFEWSFFGGICENDDNRDNSNDEMGLNWLTMTIMMNCDGNDDNDDNDDANDNWNDEIPRKTWASGSIG